MPACWFFWGCYDGSRTQHLGCKQRFKPAVCPCWGDGSLHPYIESGVTGVLVKQIFRFCVEGACVSATNFLLAVILFILIKQFYPGAIEALGPVVLGVAVIYGCHWLVAKPPGKQRNATKLQEEGDEEAFLAHQKRPEAIRSKYDCKKEWKGATSAPSEYLREVQQLNLEYREVLQRRNGWTAGSSGRGSDDQAFNREDGPRQAGPRPSSHSFCVI